MTTKPLADWLVCFEESAGTDLQLLACCNTRWIALYWRSFGPGGYYEVPTYAKRLSPFAYPNRVQSVLALLSSKQTIAWGGRERWMCLSSIGHPA